MKQPVNPAILEVPDLVDLENDIYGIKENLNTYVGQELPESPKFNFQLTKKPRAVGKSV